MGKRNQKKDQKSCHPSQNPDSAATSGISCLEAVEQDERDGQAVVENIEEVILTQMQKRLLEVQSNAIDRLLRAYSAMIELAAVRLECKLSNTRVSGVARELKELIKVMSVYEEECR
ncbi:MAG: hypothetical protein FWE10_00955 [Rikenellaceae bacterium]|nr:hypothetical protein [Rikenellaceae bacterium]MCL2692305.1 hypothetical protein [Rikenellaceae bacterium]